MSNFSGVRRSPSELVVLPIQGNRSAPWPKANRYGSPQSTEGDQPQKEVSDLLPSSYFTDPLSETPQFVAEGVSGCVHRPSLRCNKSKRIDYTSKISKVMKTKYANKEMSEFVLMNRLDPDENFHLGTPDICPFEKSDDNNIPVSKCKIGKKILESSEDYELLIMRDGGDNLEKFSVNMKKAPDNASNRNIMTQFWTEANRLFQGVQTFIENNIIHHDLKPQNIVYNSVTNRCNFIDFGIMENCNISKSEARRSVYGFDIYHWNFPTESILLNKKRYDNFTKLTPERKLEFISGMFIENTRQISIFYEYTMKKTYSEQGDHITAWSNFFFKYIGKTKFEDFSNRCFLTYDVYGLGISLLYVLENTKHLIDENKYNKLQHLFHLMMSPSMADRLSIDEAIVVYEDILSYTDEEDPNSDVVDASKEIRDLVFEGFTEGRLVVSEENLDTTPDSSLRKVRSMEKNINEFVKEIKPLPNVDIIANITPQPRITPNSSGDLRSPSELVVRRLKAPLPNSSGGRRPPPELVVRRLCSKTFRTAKRFGSVFNPKTKRYSKNKTVKFAKLIR